MRAKGVAVRGQAWYDGSAILCAPRSPASSVSISIDSRLAANTRPESSRQPSLVPFFEAVHCSAEATGA